MQYGTTPLMVAVKENRTVVIEKLLELGAPINEQAKVSQLSFSGTHTHPRARAKTHARAHIHEPTNKQTRGKVSVQFWGTHARTRTYTHAHTQTRTHARTHALTHVHTHTQHTVFL